MGLEKAEIKSGTLNAHAEQLRKRLEAAKLRNVGLEGAATGIKQAARGIEGVMRLLAEEVKEEKIERPADEMATAALIRRWLLRAHGITTNLADKTSMEGLRVEGQIRGIQDSIDFAESAASQEDDKAAALQAPDTDPDRRSVGQHPGEDLGAARKAQAAASGSDAQGPGDGEQSPPGAAVAQESGKKRTRKKKSTVGAAKKSRRRRKEG